MFHLSIDPFSPYKVMASGRQKNEHLPFQQILLQYDELLHRVTRIFLLRHRWGKEKGDIL